MKFLYHLSKTDFTLIVKCNNRTKMHQRALGLFVLLTALFALFSGYYALTTIFGEWDEYTRSYLLAPKEKVTVIVCSFLYAIMIAAIDREIVSSKNKIAALLRIPLAILIGIIISVPIKLKVLEGRINQQIKEEQIAKMMPYKHEKDRFIANIDSTINNLELQISYYTKLKSDEQKRIEAEDIGLFGNGFSGIPGQGIRYNYAKRNVDRYTQILKELKTEIKNKNIYKEDRLAQMEKDFKMYKTVAVYDFWSKHEALHQIVREDGTSQTKFMVIGLSLLFVLLELIPSIIKILTPVNEYDMVLNYLDKIIKNKLERSLEETEINLEMENLILIPEIKFA